MSKPGACPECHAEDKSLCASLHYHERIEAMINQTKTTLRIALRAGYNTVLADVVKLLEKEEATARSSVCQDETLRAQIAKRNAERAGPPSDNPVGCALCWKPDAAGKTDGSCEWRWQKTCQSDCACDCHARITGPWFG